MVDVRDYNSEKEVKKGEKNHANINCSRFSYRYLLNGKMVEKLY